MKKFLFLTMSLLITCIGVNAEVLKVETITPFSTDNSPATIELRSLGVIQLTKNVKISEGDILKGSLVDIKNPKRLKRDASFNFEIMTVTDNFGQIHSVSENNVAKYTPDNKINKGQIAKSAALSVGNHFVKGLTVGFRAIEGAVDGHAEGENIAKGAVTNVYKNSPLSYVEKGQDLVFEAGDEFYLKLNSVDEIEEYEEKNAPNYSFEVEK